MESRSRLSNALQANRVPELESLGLIAVPYSTGKIEIVSGSVANVACVEDDKHRRFAVRVANEVGNGVFWQRHYGSMEDGIPRSARKYFPERIQPLNGGITIVGRKMPTVLMEWIEGPTLLAAVNRAIALRNDQVLEALAGSLHDLSIGLRDSRVTHGDLNPQNLMLRTSGDIVCVDLDTLEWPGVRKRIHDVPEHAYRHPRRSGTPAHQDAFAILVMYCSIIIMRETHDVVLAASQDTGDVVVPLLFNTWDLQDPQSSETFALVRENTSPVGRMLLNVLERACSAEAFRAQELLDEAFDGATESGSTSFSSGSGESAWEMPDMHPEEIDISAAVARLRDLYGTSSSDQTRPAFDFADTWPEPTSTPIDRSANRAPMWQIDIPEPTVTEVLRRPVERIARRSDRQLAQVLEDEARAANELDRKIARAGQEKDDELVLSLARAAMAENLVLEESSRRIIRQSQQRTEIRDRLTHALETNSRRDLADLAVSGELALLGDTTRDSLVKVLQALEWPSLLNALETDDDTLIMLWFDAEVFEDVRSLPTAMRIRVDLARTRLQWLEDVHNRLEDRDAEALELLVTNEPAGGRQRLSPSQRRRVGEFIDRRRSLAELERSLKSGNMQRVVSALSVVEHTGAVIEDPQVWAEVQKIVVRSQIVQSAISAAQKQPPDDRALAAIVPQMKEMGVSHDPALRGDFSIEKLEAMIIRGAAIRRIRRGIEQNDDRAIRLASSPDTTGALKLLTAAERERVEIARSRKRVRRLVI